MALTKTVTFSLPGYSGELTAASAYTAITGLSGNKKLLTIQATTFDSSSRSNQLSTASFRFVPALNQINFIEQAYLHLKTLPEFSDAVDC